MAKIVIPSTRRSYYTQPQAAAFAEKLTLLRARYGAMVDRVAGLCSVPAFALFAKMLIENTEGNAGIISSAGAVGLLQIKPLSATDMLTIERRARRLSEDENKELKRLVPAKFAALDKSQMGNQLITIADLKRPEVNLLIGAIHLSTLIAEHTDNDVIRMDIVGLRYNQGYYYRRSSLAAFSGTTDELLGTLSGEARDYVIKLCGVNGALELTT